MANSLATLTKDFILAEQSNGGNLPQDFDTSSCSSFAYVGGVGGTCSEEGFTDLTSGVGAGKPTVYTSLGATAKSRAAATRRDPLSKAPTVADLIPEEDLQVEDSAPWTDLNFETLTTPKDPLYRLTSRLPDTDKELVEYLLNSPLEVDKVPGHFQRLFKEDSWKVHFSNYHCFSKAELESDFMDRTVYLMVTGQAAELLRDTGVCHFGGRLGERWEGNAFMNFATSFSRAAETTTYHVNDGYIQDLQDETDCKFKMLMINFTRLGKEHLLVRDGEDLTFNRVYASWSYYTFLQGDFDQEGNLDKKKMPTFLHDESRLTYTFVDFLPETLREKVNSGDLDIKEALMKVATITCFDFEADFKCFKDFEDLVKRWEKRPDFLYNGHTFRFGLNDLIMESTYRCFMTMNRAHFGSNHANTLLERERTLARVQSHLRGLKEASDLCDVRDLNVDWSFVTCAMRLMKDADLITSMVQHDRHFRDDNLPEVDFNLFKQGLTSRGVLTHYIELIDFHLRIVRENLNTLLLAAEDVRNTLAKQDDHWTYYAWSRAKALLARMTCEEIEATFQWFGLDYLVGQNLNHKKMKHLAAHFFFSCHSDFKGLVLDAYLTVIDLSFKGELTSDKVKKLDGHFRNNNYLESATSENKKYFESGVWGIDFDDENHYLNK